MYWGDVSSFVSEYLLYTTVVVVVLLLLVLLLLLFLICSVLRKYHGSQCHCLRIIACPDYH